MFNRSTDPTRSRLLKSLVFPGALAVVLFSGAVLQAQESNHETPVAKGSFSVPHARVGDTVEYVLRVEWKDVPAGIMVLPPGEELRTLGFALIGQSALHRKFASVGGVRNISEFTYQLIARDEGQARISPFLLRYRNGVSAATGDQVETIPVAGANLDVGPARIPFFKQRMVLVGAAFLAFVALVIALILLTMTLAAAKRARNPKNARAPGSVDAEDAFTRSVDGLKARCDSADSRIWLRDAEKLCIAYLCQHLGVGRVQEVRFEAALDQYQARQSSPKDPERDQSWTKLRDLFHEARYAGGRKDPYELREACRHMKICLTSHLKQNDSSFVKLEKT